MSEPTYCGSCGLPLNPGRGEHSGLDECVILLKAELDAARARCEGLAGRAECDFLRFRFWRQPLEIPMPTADPLDRDTRRMLETALADGRDGRQVFSDWLEERSDPRAEAVRGLEIDWRACAEVLRDRGLSVPAEVAMHARFLLLSTGQPVVLHPAEQAVLAQAEINLRFTLAWLFRPLLDANEPEATWRLRERGIAVEDLATGPLGEEGPEVRLLVPPTPQLETLGYRYAPRLGRVRQLWAVGGRLYGDLRLRPDVDGRGLTGGSVEVAFRPEGPTNLRCPFVRAVALRSDPKEEAESLMKFMGGIRPPCDTGKLFNSLGRPLDDPGGEW